MKINYRAVYNTGSLKGVSHRVLSCKKLALPVLFLPGYSNSRLYMWVYMLLAYHKIIFEGKYGVYCIPHLQQFINFQT